MEPLLERYGVQLYLAGHDHDLELQRGPGSGVTHVLTGAGSQTRGFRGTTDSLFQHAAAGASPSDVSGAHLLMGIATEWLLGCLLRALRVNTGDSVA